MTPTEQKKISKFLSLVLRHRPNLANLSLDAQGWCDVSALIDGANAAGQNLTSEQLQNVVSESNKQRFTLSSDGLRIRAAQGHSVNVALGLTASSPPPFLFHGTARKSLASIKGQGLLPGKRQQVHLSKDIETATVVGARHGSPVVFEIDTLAAQEDGHLFYISDNGVWLTDAVPTAFLRLIDEG